MLVELKDIVRFKGEIQLEQVGGGTVPGDADITMHEPTGVVIMLQKHFGGSFDRFVVGVLDAAGEIQEKREFTEKSEGEFFKATGYFEELINKRSPDKSEAPPSVGKFYFRKKSLTVSTSLSCFAQIYGNVVNIADEDVEKAFTPPLKKPFGRLDMTAVDKPEYDAVRSKFALKYNEEASKLWAESIKTDLKDVAVYDMTPYSTEDTGEDAPDEVNDDALSPDKIEGEDLNDTKQKKEGEPKPPKPPGPEDDDDQTPPTPPPGGPENDDPEGPDGPQGPGEPKEPGDKPKQPKGPKGPPGGPKGPGEPPDDDEDDWEEEPEEEDENENEKDEPDDKDNPKQPKGPKGPKPKGPKQPPKGPEDEDDEENEDDDKQNDSEESVRLIRIVPGDEFIKIVKFNPTTKTEKELNNMVLISEVISDNGQTMVVDLMGAGLNTADGKKTRRAELTRYPLGDKNNSLAYTYSYLKEEKDQGPQAKDLIDALEQMYDTDDLVLKWKRQTRLLSSLETAFSEKELQKEIYPKLGLPKTLSKDDFIQLVKKKTDSLFNN